jgi:hypothetical protein
MANDQCRGKLEDQNPKRVSRNFALPLCILKFRFRNSFAIRHSPFAISRHVH